MIHHRSFFPLVVVVLSLLLAGLIYWSVSEPQSPSSSVAFQEETSVDPQEYRSDLKQLLTTFHEHIDTAQDDLDRLRAVEAALDGMLTLRVPAEFKDVHLALAVALSQMRTSLQTGDRSIAAPLADIAELEQTHSWLTSNYD